MIPLIFDCKINSKKPPILFTMSMRSFTVILFFILATSLSGFSQNKIDLNKTMSMQDIILPAALQHGQEFSGLCTWGEDRIILLPQNAPYVYYSTTGKIRKALSTRDTLEVDKILLNIYEIEIAVNALHGNRSVFDGLEAIVFTGDHFILSIETGDRADSCHWVNAEFTDGRLLADCTNIKSLPKLKGQDRQLIHNSGFESVVWLPAPKHPLFLFEFNSLLSSKAIGYRAGTKYNYPVTVGKLAFRITDAFFENGSVIALNYNYRNENAIIQPNEISEFGLKIHPHESDIARIVSARYNPKKGTLLSWKLIGHLPLTENLNWEGICRYEDGFLLVSDDNKRLITKLVFIN